ncbi:MAG: 50S ribosomal protein L9 [bacterium]|nr:50S ribosomal protein L9 [bacterium]
MKNVEVLLRNHIDGLGRCGDVVRVAPGYARNFLLPYNHAIPATDDNKKHIARRVARFAAEEAAHAAEVAATVEQLSKLVVSTSGKADESGHLYGSVNAATVAQLCAAEGRGVDEKSVRLETPIKKIGEHKVRVHVHGDEFAEITVLVGAEA